MSYKIIISIALTLLSFSGYSQNQKVGINIEDPTEALDVGPANSDSSEKPHLRVRSIPKFGSSRSLCATNGVLGYTTEFALHSIESKIAEEPKDIKVRRKSTIDNYPLDLETTVTIPANTEAKVIIEYSVPVSLLSGKGSPGGYAGVKFMRKEGNEPIKERRGGSRKYTVDRWKKLGTVVTVINKYVEEFPSEPREQTITYSLYAYIEQVEGGRRDYGNYRFNMYDNEIGKNRNWGKGIITHKVYLK